MHYSSRHRAGKRRRERTIVFFVLSVLLLTFLFHACWVRAQDVKTYIPKNAIPLLPIVQTEQSTIFSDLPTPHYFGGLIEHESCLSLTHSRCWSPKSRLKTSREEGAGLMQLTRAWDANSKLRFDTLTDLSRKYPKELKELTWANVYDRPDLQIRAGIILLRENYRALSKVPNPYDRLAMADSAYNGGLGNLNKSRTACGLAKNCDPNRWFGNVENYLVQSRAVLYGKRSANDINRHHVSDVLLTRTPKYRPYLYRPS